MHKTLNYKYIRLVSIAIICMPILQCYNFRGIAVNKFLMLFLIILLLMRKLTINCASSKLKIFLAYAFTMPPIVALLFDYSSHFVGSFVQLGLFFVLYLLMLPYVDIEIIKRYYKVFVWAAISVFVTQEIMGVVTGGRFGVLIPFLDLYNDVPVSSYLSHYTSFDRSCSFFVEPSHFVQYIAPYLAIVLNDISKKGKFYGIEPILISFAFLFSRSGTGYFLCATIWIVHFVTCQMKTYKKLMVVLPLTIIIVFYGLAYFSKTEMGTEVMDRYETIDANYSGDSRSGTIRIYRGFWVQATMPIITQVLGVGLGGTNDVIDKSPLALMFYDEYYVNNASGFLIAFGYIGTILFLLYIISLCNRKNTGSVMIISAFVCLCFLESFLFDSRMLLYIIIPYAYNLKLINKLEL